MRKKIGILLLLLLLAMTAGCGKESKEEDSATDYHINYINKDTTKIIETDYEPKGRKTKELVEEFMECLSTDTDSVEYRKPIPDNVEVLKDVLDGGQLSIYFSPEYSEMDAITEILCRAAVVRTMTQITGIDCVSFYVGDAPLTDSKGKLIGVMTADSFIENPGEQINSIQTTNLTLYFANKAGDALVKETRNVHYSSNIAVEKLVVEQLLEGPDTKNLQATIPEGTNSVGVTVSEGVCYVNLDEGFTNQNYGITESTVIYSIVDSLSELSTVSRVQISVNGDTSGVYRDKFKLDTLYERDLDYVESKEGTVEDITSAEESDKAEEKEDGSASEDE